MPSRAILESKIVRRIVVSRASRVRALPARKLAQDYAAMLFQFRREWHMAQESAETAMALCAERGFA
jgi:hypothetical protein